MSKPPTDDGGTPTEKSRGVDAWKEHTKAIDRVIEVALSLEEPRTAAWLSEEAHVAEGTARDHLERLVELRALTSATTHGVTSYYPDSAYLRFRDVSRFAEEYTKDKLSEYITKVKERVEDLEETHDVSSPDELRAKAADEDASAADAREYRQLASEWDSLEYQLSTLQEAVRRYDEFDHDPAQTQA